MVGITDNKEIKEAVLAGLQRNKEKCAALFNLAVLNYANPMPPALYNLKYRAIQERAYVHPGWDYLKYPAVELEVCYSNLTSNKMYNEELDEDGYPILVFVGRCNSL